MYDQTMDPAAIAHGMDGRPVRADWPSLTRSEVRALLNEFPFSAEPVEILSVSPRPFSAASVVQAGTARVFVKRHHCSVRNREGLEEEHRFLEYLYAHEAPVPQLLKSASGKTAIEKGEWTYEVHRAAPGIDLYEDAISWTPFRCSAHARAAGAALARLHLGARGFDTPRRSLRPLVAGFSIFAANDPVVEMDRYLNARPSLAEDRKVRACTEQTLELLAPFHGELVPLLPHLTPLWTHNDLHASNLFWSDAGDRAHVVAIVDFGLSDRTNAVHDLAHAIERNIVEWLALVERPDCPEDVPVHFDHLAALLAGYESVRPLTEEEAAALAPLTALCHAEFALSEADYFLSVLHAKDKAPMAYDGWLVGHARWFRGTGGRKLLDALHRWSATRMEVVR